MILDLINFSFEIKQNKKIMKILSACSQITEGNVKEEKKMKEKEK